MTIRKHAEKAAEDVFGILGTPGTDEQSREIPDAIEKAIIEAVLEEAGRCAEVAKACCSADRDMAHKIAEEIHRSHEVLIANLSSMR